VLTWDDGVVLLRNERGEWELPGGRLETSDPSPESALRREFAEELALEVDVGDMIDSWIYDVEGKRVLIITYSCTADQPDRLEHSDEHQGVTVLAMDGLRSEPLPAGYRRSIYTHKTKQDRAG
jgi:8-oxo-dGTP pyrophosphatase MutT (NUDIX family)